MPESHSIQSRLNEYWSRWAPEYESHQRTRLGKEGEVAAWQRVWGEALPPAPADVVDLGTGSGHAAFVIASLGHRVTGLDLAEGMLAEAEAKRAAGGGGAEYPRFRLGDAADPDLAPGSVDALTARYFLWTLREPEASLRRWLEVLRPGGVLVVVDSLWFPGGLAAHAAPREGLGDERADHFTDAYGRSDGDLPLAGAEDIGEFARRIEAAGFSDVRVDELTEIMELDHRHGVAPGHRVQPQYRIRAVRG